MPMTDRLQRLRSAHGESIRQAAERCGISHPTWSRMERGESEGDDETLGKIAVGYGVTVEYIRWGRDLQTEFAEHLRSLTATQRGALLTDPKARLHTLLRFLQQRGGSGQTPAAIANAAHLAETDVLRAISNPSSVTDEVFEKITGIVEAITGGHVRSDWVRHGLEEIEQFNKVVADSLTHIADHLQGKQKAKRHPGAASQR